MVENIEGFFFCNRPLRFFFFCAHHVLRTIGVKRENFKLNPPWSSRVVYNFEIYKEPRLDMIYLVNLYRNRNSSKYNLSNLLVTSPCMRLHCIRRNVESTQGDCLHDARSLEEFEFGKLVADKRRHMDASPNAACSCRYSAKNRDGRTVIINVR